VWDLRREAVRRGLDLIVVAAHNNRFALDLARLAGTGSDDVIVLPGQEVTAARYHLIAAGIDRIIDWRLGAREAIAAIHAQGGVAIAAHPVRASWRDPDEAALGALDGVEVAHPGQRITSPDRDEYLQFYRRVQMANPDIAPIGSSDFHTAAPLGLCRTYLLVQARTAAGALDAIRAGRTVARSPSGQLQGAAGHVAEVERYLAGAGMPGPSAAERAVALAALAGLAALAVPPRRRQRR
jgi:predicted metal-dependent phosphoesterase TrpH